MQIAIGVLLMGVIAGLIYVSLQIRLAGPKREELSRLKAVNEQAYKSPSAASGFPFPPYDNPFDGFFSTLVAGACEKAPSPSRFNDILHEVLLARDAIQLLTAPFTGPLDLLIGWGVFLLKQRLGADPLQDCISNGYALWYKNACCPQ